jgi:hypothetical protein
MPAGHVPSRRLPLAALICCACLGCETAHYVIRNPNNGVVAIPEDTPELRAKAEKLMHEHFPNGYVIDDVRVVALGRPYETMTRVGPFAEIETHQRHETMLYYHAGQPARFVPSQVGTPVVKANAPAGSITPPPPLPTSPAEPSLQQIGLPPQPVPVQ